MHICSVLSKTQLGMTVSREPWKWHWSMGSEFQLRRACGACHRWWEPCDCRWHWRAWKKPQLLPHSELIDTYKWNRVILAEKLLFDEAQVWSPCLSFKYLCLSISLSGSLCFLFPQKRAVFQRQRRRANSNKGTSRTNKNLPHVNIFGTKKNLTVNIFQN